MSADASSYPRSQAFGISFTPSTRSLTGVISCSTCKKSSRHFLTICRDVLLCSISFQHMDTESRQKNGNLDLDAKRSAATLPTAHPATFRLPRPGERCQYFGLSRTEYYSLIHRGEIKSYTLKKPGRGRGIRLLDFNSVLGAITKAT